MPGRAAASAAEPGVLQSTQPAAQLNKLCTRLAMGTPMRARRIYYAATTAWQAAAGFGGGTRRRSGWGARRRAGSLRRSRCSFPGALSPQAPGTALLGPPNLAPGLSAGRRSAFKHHGGHREERRALVPGVRNHVLDGVGSNERAVTSRQLARADVGALSSAAVQVLHTLRGSHNLKDIHPVLQAWLRSGPAAWSDGWLEGALTRSVLPLIARVAFGAHGLTLRTGSH